MSGYISTERDGYFAVTKPDRTAGQWFAGGSKRRPQSKPTLRSKPFELRRRNVGLHLDGARWLLCRDEARPDGWPMVRREDRRGAPNRSRPYDPNRSNSTTQCRATSRRSEMATFSTSLVTADAADAATAAATADPTNPAAAAAATTALPRGTGDKVKRGHIADLREER